MTFDPRVVCTVLEEEGIWFVLIGGFAATIHGSPLPTSAVDIKRSVIAVRAHNVSATLQGVLMPTLHIEHAITDRDVWLGAFGRFAEARTNAGVVTQRVRQPVDDPKYIVVDLEFETVEAAEEFKTFLEAVVWQSTDLSPGLGGVPTARVLQDLDAVG